MIEPELVKAEPKRWKLIGQEVSRQLDYQPGKFFWQETVRPKYVRLDQRALPPMIAPAPKRVAERLDRALKKLQPRYLPQSLMDQAIGYARDQSPMLERFLDHGEVEIDNNLVVNAIRLTVLGKKNWLFIGSEEASQRSSVIYTLIENCRTHGVEPYTYLRHVLERLPHTNQQVARPTPLKWQQARQSALKQAA